MSGSELDGNQAAQGGDRLAGSISQLDSIAERTAALGHRQEFDALEAQLEAQWRKLVADIPLPRPSMPSAAELAADRYDGSVSVAEWLSRDEDRQFPVVDWKYEVENDDTRLGYHEWVDNRREASAHDEPQAGEFAVSSASASP